MARTSDPAMGRHRQYFEVRDALRQAGCPVCRLALGAVWRFLDSLAYENVNDYTVRAELRRAWGFCNRHAWQYLEDVRDLLGTAIIYRDILRSNGPAVGRPGGLTPRAACPVCAARDRTARHALETLVRYGDDPEMAEALAGSAGLCAVHAAQALPVGEDAAGLVRAVAERWTGGARPAAQAVGEPDFAGTRVGWDWQPRGAPDGGGAAAPRGEGCGVCAAVNVADVCRDDGEDALPCNAHLWALARRDAEAAAEAGRRALGRVQRRLLERAETRRSALLAAVLETVGVEHRTDDPCAGFACPACRRQRGIESDLAPAALAEGQPLCVPHLRVALRAADPGDRALAPIRGMWRELEAGLTAYVRSQDYRFRHEPRGAEQDAPRQAVRWIAGAKGIR